MTISAKTPSPILQRQGPFVLALSTRVQEHLHQMPGLTWMDVSSNTTGMVGLGLSTFSRIFCYGGVGVTLEVQHYRWPLRIGTREPL